jgi:hypothetical protein
MFSSSEKRAGEVFCWEEDPFTPIERAFPTVPLRDEEPGKDCGFRDEMLLDRGDGFLREFFERGFGMAK